MRPDGFNVGSTWARWPGRIAEHLHFHVVPRWHGDVNFLTVLGEVRSIPEHIQATCTRLKPHFAKMR